MEIELNENIINNTVNNNVEAINNNGNNSSNAIDSNKDAMNNYLISLLNFKKFDINYKRQKFFFRNFGDLLNTIKKNIRTKSNIKDKEEKIQDKKKHKISSSAIKACFVLRDYSMQYNLEKDNDNHVQWNEFKERYNNDQYFKNFIKKLINDNTFKRLQDEKIFNIENHDQMSDLFIFVNNICNMYPDTIFTTLSEEEMTLPEKDRKYAKAYEKADIDIFRGIINVGNIKFLSLISSLNKSDESKVFNKKLIENYNLFSGFFIKESLNNILIYFISYIIEEKSQSKKNKIYSIINDLNLTFDSYSIMINKFGLYRNLHNINENLKLSCKKMIKNVILYHFMCMSTIKYIKNDSNINFDDLHSIINDYNNYGGNSNFTARLINIFDKIISHINDNNSEDYNDQYNKIIEQIEHILKFAILKYNYSIYNNYSTIIKQEKRCDHYKFLETVKLFDNYKILDKLDEIIIYINENIDILSNKLDNFINNKDKFINNNSDIFTKLTDKEIAFQKLHEEMTKSMTPKKEKIFFVKLEKMIEELNKSQ